jgi:hypothetical protein
LRRLGIFFFRAFAGFGVTLYKGGIIFAISKMLNIKLIVMAPVMAVNMEG